MRFRQFRIKLNGALKLTDRFCGPICLVVANAEKVMEPRIFQSERDRFLQVGRRGGIIFLLKQKHPQFALASRKIGLDGNRLLVGRLGRCRFILPHPADPSDTRPGNSGGCSAELC